MCPPHIFLASREQKYHKVHNTAAVGVCHLLHPHLAPEAGKEEQENITNNEALIGRQIGRPDLFFAEPSNNAKMEMDLKVHPRRRERMRRVVFENLDVKSQCKEVAKEAKNNPISYALRESFSPC
jgi:hypothetical protein